MSISNLNNQHLTDEQVKKINDLLDELQRALEPLQVNLSADERKKYGSINEQNKLFVNKIEEYAKIQPALRSPEVDWEEFARDFKSRAFLETLILRLEGFSYQAFNAKILHDFDNYQDALEDYAYTNFQARNKSGAYETKVRELKQFFSKTRKQKTTSNP